MEHPRVRALRAEAEKAYSDGPAPAKLEEDFKTWLHVNDSLRVLQALGRRQFATIKVADFVVTDTITWQEREKNLVARHPELHIYTSVLNPLPTIHVKRR